MAVFKKVRHEIEEIYQELERKNDAQWEIDHDRNSSHGYFRALKHFREMLLSRLPMAVQNTILERPAETEGPSPTNYIASPVGVADIEPARDIKAPEYPRIVEGGL